MQRDINALLKHYSERNFVTAECLAKNLIKKHPKNPICWKVLGAIYCATGRAEDSLEPMREALRLDPMDASANSNLAITLNSVGRFEEAEKICRRAVSLKPKFAEGHSNLGMILSGLGRFEEALVSYREAIRLKPIIPETHHNKSNLLKITGQLRDAEVSCRQAIRLKPKYAKAINTLGNILRDQGRLSEAERSYREAIEIEPDFIEARTNLLSCLISSESLSPEETLEEAKKFGCMVSMKASEKFDEWLYDSQSPRIRIGFVSGDLRNHPVGFWTEDLIANLDKSRFEIYAFPTRSGSDELTERIKTFFEAWIPISNLGDFEAATLIRENKIHILIDLSGHTAHNRLPIFSYRPSPIQVTWLGYSGTTGVPEMDYILGDPHVTPISENSHFSERIWQLPDSYLCFSVQDIDFPMCPIPALANGFVTFGCFNNLGKIGPNVIALWSDILKMVPNAKLMLKTKQFLDSCMIESVTERFAEHEICEKRLILRGPTARKEHLEQYSNIDIVLDPFPNPGGTTSAESLWVGVPVLTLKGSRFMSHMGESINHNVGMSDWIAKDPEDYVLKAVTFASDLDGLILARKKLWDRRPTCPLFDSIRFTGNFEKALLEMWRTHQERT